MRNIRERRYRWTWVGALAASLGCSQPTLVVSSTAALVDDRLEIVAHGLKPFQAFTIRATTLDQRERLWIADARFVADSNGRVDLSSVAPQAGGSYETADAMGLFWSAVSRTDGAQIAHRPGTAYPTTLDLIADGALLDTKTVTRTFDAPGVERVDVREGGVVGAYYRPAGPTPVPAVVVFAGSDGGLASAEWRAALLAARGFAALAVAVFGYEDRPSNLVEIPLEDGAAAVSWLASRPETGRVGVLGFSKGTELSLSLAARDTLIDAVVVISPSAYVWPGVSDGPPERRSSWTWRGVPLAPIPWAVGREAGAMFAEGPPFRLRVLYEESLVAASEEVRAAAMIPVTDIDAPVLLISGEDDGSWPASDMARTIVEHMTMAGRVDDVAHLSYPGAGHLIFWDYLPATAAERNRGQIFGGSTPATVAARADSWPKIQAFLDSALRR